MRKIKYLNYANCGNKIKNSFANVVQIEDLQLYRTEQYVEDDRYELIAELNGIFVSVSLAYQEQIDNSIEMLREKFSSDETVLEYLNSVMGNLLNIEAVRSAGFDPSHLIEKREENIRMANERKQQRKDEEKQRQLKIEVEENNRFQELKDIFSKGGHVDSDDLIFMADKLSIPIAARTKGSIAKQTNMRISIDRVGSFISGTRDNTLNSYFKVYENIKNTLDNE